MTFKDELKGLLLVELDNLEKLLKLSFTKTQAILNDDLEQISDITLIEEKLVREVMELEDKRIKLLDNWGVKIDTPISDVVEQIPDGKKELIELRKKFKGVMEKLGDRNQVNARLIEQNLEWVEFNLNLLTSTTTPGSYGEDSKKREEKQKLFDRKV